ncbi:4-diphosphocytidyl-2-C-methyl-D-erythritol kinase [Mycoplasmoides fastidiosum]|uniref:4-diphosphocytidyl-2-C-methyl-D-erythritol kinase n=1 Tax=Mycoplasmoides fastidiosum TaxID=92758 RepID=A0ABU0LY07_9BACT|nr:hypothetical protein [Mycoplasmoides fastidiosum]MDQ0513573.1 4-diphosphocytidyl-2-C-methyl-D-erythritol kinase [Mycoplasmoides fastidiosum]UUD38005.1 hypothetical protein NPA10_01250 [Mycoplasmoides fastidiosum]
MILQAHPRITFGLKTFKYAPSYKKTPFDSVFVLVPELYDELHLTKNPTLEVRYFDPAGNLLHVQNDLVTKAAFYLSAHHSINVNLRIDIKKNIPLGSGLGSVAACAAALIKYYADRFDLPINFRHIATSVSPDIPFFLTGFKVGRVQNFGDEVVGYTHIQLPKMKLHFTNIALDETQVREVFKIQPKFLANNYVSKLVSALTNNQPFEVFNEYQSAVFQISPELFLMQAKLKTPFNQIFTCGTGSTLIELNDPHFTEENH